MRVPASIFLIVLFAMSCVKKVSNNPVPRIEYKTAFNFGKSKLGSDTAVVVIEYEDGDGDLFVDDFSQGPNLFMYSSYYDSTQAKFVVDNNGIPFTYSIKQPDNGYYKGKAIKGEIYIPMREYRSSDARKIIKFDIFMVDQNPSKNKTNVVTSPVYTLNF